MQAACCFLAETGRPQTACKAGLCMLTSFRLSLLTVPVGIVFCQNHCPPIGNDQRADYILIFLLTNNQLPTFQFA